MYVRTQYGIGIFHAWGYVPRFTRLVKLCADLLGRGQDETLNTKGKLVGMDMDVILDRGSTPLTSTSFKGS